MSETLEYETRPEPTPERREACARWCMGLVVAWSPNDPQAQGAWIPIEEGGRRVFGRDAKPQRTGVARGLPSANLLRQRPGTISLLPALANPSLSRVQLILHARAGTLHVENHGKLALRINGQAASCGTLVEGDVVELGTTLILVCSRRPEHLPAASVEFEFGQADPDGMVGEAAAMWQLRAEIERCAAHSGHVLIMGESGVGKELVARALHVRGRAAGDLVARNAATIPESLVDAELFGNAKGYPAHGLPERPGLIGEANRGTLFLDEFADLPQPAQASLLRVLDSGEYHRLGESRSRNSIFRLVAATCQSESRMREDLVARFEFTILVPSLATRSEDIPWLAAHLLRDMTREQPALQRLAFSEAGVPQLCSSFVARLIRHRFDTNTRMLRKLLWRSLLQANEPPLVWPLQGVASTFDVVAAQQAVRSEPSNNVAMRDEGASTRAPRAFDLPNGCEDSVSVLSAEQLQAALDANNGSLEATYRALGLSSRHALSRLVRKHALRVTRWKPGQ